MSRGKVFAALALAVALSGCLFTVEHRLPPNTYFGQLPKRSGEQAVSFARSEAKNWALVGLVPYTDWGTANLLPESAQLRRVEGLSIETLFTTRDTLIWVFPGFAYGYYFWAPRTIRVQGTEIRSEP